MAKGPTRKSIHAPAPSAPIGKWNLRSDAGGHATPLEASSSALCSLGTVRWSAGREEEACRVKNDPIGIPFNQLQKRR